MIHRLRVRGYKSLVDSTVDFDRLTVIFGPNGAGKSNLLDLIGLLSRMASSETLRGAFADHRGRPAEAFHSAEGFGPKAYKRFLERERIAFRVECDLELHPRIVDEVNRGLQERERLVQSSTGYTRVSESRLRYTLEITLHPSSGELFVTDESLQPLKRDFEPKAPSVRNPFISRETVRDGAEGAPHRFVARIEKQSHPRYFDTNRPRTLLSELSDPVYHPHVVAAAKEISSWRVYYVEPARMRADVAVQSVPEPGRAGELLPAYYYYLQQKHPATLRGIVANLQELVPGLQDLRVDVREGLLEIVSTQAGGAEFPARLLSEGTLRLLCVLGIAVTPAPPPVVVYEEPENGVNPARLDLITQIIRTAATVRPDGPQFLITTQSPLVCNQLPESLVLCAWNRERGTTFTRFPWDRDSLYYEHEIIKALDGLSAAQAVAERCQRDDESTT